MRSILVALIFSLVSTVVSAETVGRFERFVWEESITIPANGHVYTSPIDTSEHASMAVQFSELNNQSVFLFVNVQSKIFEGDAFSAVTKNRNSRDFFGLEIHDDWWREGIVHTAIVGTKTRLAIKNNANTDTTLRISVALIRPVSGPVGPQGEQGLVGPQGDQGIAGVTPEELQAMQLMIDQNRQLLEELPQLKKQIEEITAGSS